MGVPGLLGSRAPPECPVLCCALQGGWSGWDRCCWCSVVSPGAQRPRGSGCSSSTAPTSVGSGFNGPAPCKDEIYGWAIKEKLERKIYNFPLKPVIHVINIDVI